MLHDQQQVGVSRVLGDDHYKQMPRTRLTVGVTLLRTLTAQWPWVPSTGQNLKPFTTGNSDVLFSSGTKNPKQTNTKNIITPSIRRSQNLHVSLYIITKYTVCLIYGKDYKRRFLNKQLNFTLFLPKSSFLRVAGHVIYNFLSPYLTIGFQCYCYLNLYRVVYIDHYRTAVSKCGRIHTCT